MKNFAPVETTKITKTQRSGAVSYLMFLKEKRNGHIKGCTCVDIRKQQDTIKKEDAASLTVATESVFITAAVYAHEGLDVVTFDIPGTYLHTGKK